jgi:hypothetical protein
VFKPGGGRGHACWESSQEGYGGKGGEERVYRTVKEVAQSVDDRRGYIDCLGFGVDGVYVWL